MCLAAPGSNISDAIGLLSGEGATLGLVDGAPTLLYLLLYVSTLKICGHVLELKLSDTFNTCNNLKLLLSMPASSVPRQPI